MKNYYIIFFILLTLSYSFIACDQNNVSGDKALVPIPYPTSVEAAQDSIPSYLHRGSECDSAVPSQQFSNCQAVMMTDGIVMGMITDIQPAGAPYAEELYESKLLDSCPKDIEAALNFSIKVDRVIRGKEVETIDIQVPYIDVVNWGFYSVIENGQFIIEAEENSNADFLYKKGQRIVMSYVYYDKYDVNFVVWDYVFAVMQKEDKLYAVAPRDDRADNGCEALYIDFQEPIEIESWIKRNQQCQEDEVSRDYKENLLANASFYPALKFASVCIKEYTEDEIYIPSKEIEEGEHTDKDGNGMKVEKADEDEEIINPEDPAYEEPPNPTPEP